MNKYLLTAMALTIGLTSLAQLNTQKFWDFQDAMARDAAPKINALGSPYVQDEFEPVKVKRFKDKVYNASYNAYNGEMHIETPGKLIALDINDSYEVTFLKSNKTYRTFTYSDESGVSKRGFLVVVHEEDNFALLKSENVSFREEKKAVTSYDKDKPAQFKRENDDYYYKSDNSIKYMPNKSKDLLKAFPKHAKKIKAYMKSEKLNPKDEEELIKIAAYISTL